MAHNVILYGKKLAREEFFANLKSANLLELTFLFGLNGKFRGINVRELGFLSDL